MEAKHKHKKGVMIGYKNNQLATIDSREVAEMLGKEHSELLKEIEGRKDNKNVGIIPTLEKGNFHLSNYFIPSTYRSGTREYKCYLVTKMGCELLGNKQQGEKGILFTAKYVERFNEMEQAIKGQARPLTTEETLELQFKYAKEIREKVDNVDNRVTTLEERMTIETGAQKVLQDLVNNRVKVVLGGRDTPAYKELAKKTYSQCWRNFKNVLQVASYKDTPVKDFDLAKKVIIDWQPNRELELMIRGCNAQMRM